jgi:fructan beta-fructosidase
MHWGHAESRDLIHWKQLPIALYPDSLGYIFSGSAVVDSQNTSGFGSAGRIPLVAIFTHHDPKGAKARRNDYQNESVAYSLDNGKTWTKYAGNPVLKNPGIADFRDPKVMWYAPGKKWVMTLATKDRITFYSSPDLKTWSKESEFGADLGAHGGVWECPDLFALKDEGKPVWVLIVNINPGGPNKGSATQYFLGQFDGHAFTTNDRETKWLDYGPDEYAGVTWSNTGDRRIFLGWMSNWLYANQVPTVNWRNAMTVPRELGLRHTDKGLFVVSSPVRELGLLASKPRVVENWKVDGQTVPAAGMGLDAKMGPFTFPCRLEFSLDQATDFLVVLSNKKGEKMVIGYGRKDNQYFIDRTASGDTRFYPAFASRHSAPRLTDRKDLRLSLIVDVSSVELFADDGLSVMTEIFFPSEPYTWIRLQTNEPTVFRRITYAGLAGIWPLSP